MHVAYEVPRISVAATTPSATDVDVLIVPVAQDHTADAVGAFDAAVGGDLNSALDRGEFQAKAGDVFSAAVRDKAWRAARVVFVGGGPRAEIGAERFRRMAVTAACAVRTQHRRRVAWVDAEPGVAAVANRIETIAEGLTLGNFDNGFHKSKNDQQFFFTEATLLASRRRRRRGG